jgi:hypothetical protein
MCAAVLCAVIQRSPGPSPRNPSIIRNCQFLNFWRHTGGTGIGIEMGTLTPLSNNWLVQGNTFDSTRQGVFVNANSNIRILDNSFTR